MNRRCSLSGWVGVCGNLPHFSHILKPYSHSVLSVMFRHEHRRGMRWQTDYENDGGAAAAADAWNDGYDGMRNNVRVVHLLDDAADADADADDDGNGAKSLWLFEHKRPSLTPPPPPAAAERLHPSVERSQINANK